MKVLASVIVAAATLHPMGAAAERPGAERGEIVVSCFRGPWKEVIWDRPNAVFVDSLVTAGFDFPTAHSIAERLCRDEALVGNPDAMRDTLLRILRDEGARR